MRHHPRLCFVGPMVGRHTGYVTTQGMVLSDRFAQAGYRVVAVSSQTNRCRRLIDVTRTLIDRRHEIDIQLLEIYGGISFVLEDVASGLGKALGQRVVMTLHGGALPAFMTRYPNWTRRVLGRADAIVAPSLYLQRAVQRLGYDAQVIPNLIDVDYVFRPRRRVEPRLFWMRTFHPVWNPEMAIRVLARVRTRRPDATLVMAGQDKGMQSQIQAMVRQHGLDEAVRFPGFLSADAKRREGDAADIYINTSRIDNTPVAVLEACAMGLPVVSTAIGGVPDLLTEGETGLLVADNDDEAMAQAIERLVHDPALVERLSRNGRRLAERSSWLQLRERWERLFSEVISGKAAEACAVSAAS